MRPAKYFYDNPLPKYLDPKTVLIYRPHPVCCTGPPGNVGQRHRFLGSINVTNTGSDFLFQTVSTNTFHVQITHVWSSWSYIIPISLFSILYNVPKFLELEEQIFLCQSATRPSAGIGLQRRAPQCLSLRRNWVLPSPPPQANVSPPWKEEQHNPLRVKGWGTQFGRLEREPSTVYTLWFIASGTAQHKYSFVSYREGVGGSISNDRKKAWPSLLFLSHVECTSLPFPHHTTCAKSQMAQSVCVSQIPARGRRVNFHRRLFSFPKSLSESKETAPSHVRKKT